MRTKYFRCNKLSAVITLHQCEMNKTRKPNWVDNNPHAAFYACLECTKTNDDKEFIDINEYLKQNPSQESTTVGGLTKRTLDRKFERINRR